MCVWIGCFRCENACCLCIRVNVDILVEVFNHAFLVTSKNYTDKVWRLVAAYPKLTAVRLTAVTKKYHNQLLFPTFSRISHIFLSYWFVFIFQSLLHWKHVDYFMVFFKERSIMKWERNFEGHIIFSTTWRKYTLFKNVE